MDPTRTRLALPALLVVLIVLIVGLLNHDLHAEEEKVHGLSWWQSLADNGFASAQFHLAKEYAYGGDLNLPRDETKAFGLFELAAKQDYTEAQYELGLAYEKGRGAKQNNAKAMQWYSKAANKNHELAKHALARLKRGPGSNTKLGAFVSTWNKLVDIMTKPATGHHWPWWLNGLVFAAVFIAYRLLSQQTLYPEKNWLDLFAWKPRGKSNLDDLLGETPAAEENLPLDTNKSGSSTETRYISHALLLLGIVFGGLMGSLGAVDLGVDFSLHGDFKRLLGDGVEVWAVLLTGGVLMGVGLQLLRGGFWSSAMNTRVFNIKGNLQYTSIILFSAVVFSLLMEMAAG